MTQPRGALVFLMTVNDVAVPFITASGLLLRKL